MGIFDWQVFRMVSTSGSNRSMKRILCGIFVVCVSIFTAVPFASAAYIADPVLKTDETSISNGEKEVVRGQSNREGRAADPTGYITNGQEVQPPVTPYEEQVEPNVLDMFVSDAPKKVSLYDSGAALVRQTLLCSLNPGENKIILSDLPQSINIATAELISEIDGVSVVSKGTVSDDFGVVKLMWTVNSQTACDASFLITYMLDGLEWSVDYSALVSADGQNANFVGTISIANPTDANLTSSYLEMVSSNPSFPGEKVGHTMASTMGLRCYEIEGMVDIPSYSILTVDLCRLNGLDVQTRYMVEDTSSAPSAQIGDREKLPVELELRLSNVDSPDKVTSRDLPSGKVRVFVKSEDHFVFLLYEGEVETIDADVPSLCIRLGSVPDVYVERVCTDKKKVGTSSWEDAYQLVFHNLHKSEMAVSLVKDFPSDWTVLQSTPFGWTKTDDGKAQLDVTVEGLQNMTVLFKVRYTSLGI